MKQRPRFTPHPQSAPGDFYAAYGACGSCGVPQVVAPELVGWTDAKHCFWMRQPETPEQIKRAIAVLETQELGCHRYAGRDPEILKRISAEYCDYPVIPTSPHTSVSTGPRSSQFAPVDCPASRIAKIWKRITNA